MKTLIVIAILLFTPLYATALDFQGFTMGMTKEQINNFAVNTKIPITCYSNSCTLDTKIKGAPVNAILSLEEGTLQIIYIKYNPSEYETIRSALIQKYGKPKFSEEKLVQNRMGASFKNKTGFWLLEDGQIHLDTYSYTLEFGSVMMYAASYIDKQEIKMKSDAASTGF